MLNILDRIYSAIPNKTIILRCIRYIIRVTANVYANTMMRCSSKNRYIDTETVIVSLTSFPARINNLHITIVSLLNQNFDNIHIVLWLSREQFPNELNSLPQSLVRLTDKGLDIRFVDDDLRPHKKYFYSFKTWPNNCIITVDDDIIYNPFLVDALLKKHQRYPNCVICNRGINIGVGSYTTWKHINAQQTGIPTYKIMPTGIGGVLYPPNCYDKEHIFNVEAIKKTCLNGDDLWLNFMTRSIGTKVVLTGFKTGLVTLLSSQSSALCNVNVGDNRNDIQIAAIDKWARESYSYGFYHNTGLDCLKN